MNNLNPNSNTSTSQRQAISAWLKSGNTITGMEAMARFGCARLAARIEELRASGMPISTLWKKTTNRQGKAVRIAEYRLEDQK